MSCILAKDVKLLTPDVRSQVVRDLVSNMFTYSTSPNHEFCTFVAQRLILKYPFMRDAVGTGYVSTLFPDIFHSSNIIIHAIISIL